MTQEDKQLLLQDLCGRLPYGVKAQVLGWDEEKGEVEVPLKIYSINTDGYVYFETNDYDVNYLPIEDVRPFLRPMSSMTEGEKREIYDWLVENDVDWFDFSKLRLDEILISFDSSWLLINWLNAHHFDYRGLIGEGLAIEVTEENNPYKD